MVNEEQIKINEYMLDSMKVMHDSLNHQEKVIAQLLLRVDELNEQIEHLRERFNFT